MANLTKDEAKRILSNTAPDRAFWVNNGPIVKSVLELATAAKKLTPAQFTHHVNNAKNDFAKCVDEVIRDAELAQHIKKAKTREDLASAVTGRLKQLQKIIR